MNSTTQSLLVELTETKLSKLPDLVEQLETQGGEELLPVFRAWLAGDLHYQTSDATLVVEVEVNGAETYQDPFSGDIVAGITSKDVKKIKVNNKLRGMLRGVIARIQLTSSNATVREGAVRELLTELDDETVATLESLYPNEANADVKAMMSTALALHTAQQKDNAVSVRLGAIDQLGDSLENDVRNVLVKLQNDGNADIAKAASKALVSINQQVERYALVDQLFFGLSLGSVLLLASIGLAITFGVMGVINMAHGEMIMLGAYTTYVVQLIMPNYIDYSIWVAIPAAFLVSGLMGVLIERLVICRLHGRPLETLLATFGISLILQQLVRTIFSPLNRQVSTPSWMSGSWEINPVLSLTLNRLYILAFSLLVFLALVLILKKSSLGLNVRAVSQNRSMAKAMGVKTEWVDAMTFGLGSGIAGIAGVALSQLTNVGPNLGQAYIIDSFMVVVFGGVGNLLGTLVAAFTLGIANKFLEPTTGAVLAAILVLVFIILFIQKRPKGLFPQKGRAAE
ncbi:urea ABC transporter permease subunit UrtB [Maribrevibacterium harenarium]|uniref:Urea ABC transporter permease subunit UrtB n=1 Tax=Maribrevibacterium harenarium TaxID=2589817 RepID=A0A501X4N4_9GAMM|nr:urea ABC transporter permease subunit UrtB [Maribrevibacterium harenarium]TPE55399.1 urea ABC transporter permease subunit UrtB [Maribrevibacterium harenarium]